MVGRHRDQLAGLHLLPKFSRVFPKVIYRRRVALEDLCLCADVQDGDVVNPLPGWSVQSMVSMVPFKDIIDEHFPHVHAIELSNRNRVANFDWFTDEALPGDAT